MLLRTEISAEPILKRRALLVVGMHRSGTSAITRMLNLLGADLSDNLLPAAAANELGHWEQLEIFRPHEGMLKTAASSWDDIFGMEPSWFRSDAGRRYAEAVAEVIQNRFASAPLFAIKDPRLALFVPLWIDVLKRLDVEPLFVLPFRHPQEVVRSLESRHALLWSAEWPLGQGELLWLRYVLSAEKATRGYPRSFVNFDALLDDWETEARRMASQLALVWPDQSRAAKIAISEFLDRKNKHENIDSGHGVAAGTSAWPTLVFDQLLACVPHPQAGAEVFDRAEREIAQAIGLFGDYVAYLRKQVDSLLPLKDEVGRISEALREANDIAARNEVARAEAQRVIDESAVRIQSAERRCADLERALAAVTVQAEGAMRTAGERGAEIQWLRSALEHHERSVAGMEHQLAALVAERDVLRAERLADQRDAEIQRQRDAEIQRQRDAENQRQRDAENQRQRDVEIQRQRDAEIQRQRDAEIQRQRDAVIQRLKTELALYEGGIAKMEQQLAALISERNAMLGSTSWQVTRVFRAIGRHVPSKGRRSVRRTLRIVWRTLMRRGYRDI